MSYPPNNPDIAARTPQHGIVAPKHATKSTTPIPVLNVNCASPRCPNTVTVVPFGHHVGPINVKVTCKECFIPVVMAELEKKEESKEEELEEEWDGEEW